MTARAGQSLEGALTACLDWTFLTSPAMPQIPSSVLTNVSFQRCLTNPHLPDHTDPLMADVVFPPRFATTCPPPPSRAVPSQATFATLSTLQQYCDTNAPSLIQLLLWLRSCKQQQILQISAVYLNAVTHSPQRDNPSILAII